MNGSKSITMLISSCWLTRDERHGTGVVRGCCCSPDSPRPPPGWPRWCRAGWRGCRAPSLSPSDWGTTGAETSAGAAETWGQSELARQPCRVSSYPGLPGWSDRRRERGGGRSRTSVCSAFSPGPHLSDSDPAPPSGLSEHDGTWTRNSYEIQIPSIESGLFWSQLSKVRVP